MQGRYRHKPTTVDAWLFSHGTSRHPDWLTEAINAGTISYQGGEFPYYTIETVNGPSRAVIGDWIIRGRGGDFWPCNGQVFADSYELAQ